MLTISCRHFLDFVGDNYLDTTHRFCFPLGADYQVAVTQYLEPLFPDNNWQLFTPDGCRFSNTYVDEGEEEDVLVVLERTIN
jgi:hypothetical protein